MEPLITVFTPTFNRAYILPQLYESLCNQSSKDFCWLIVDDGSTDGTRQLVSGWINEKKISIFYFHQRNRGKSQAHNYGVELAKSFLFTCVDSDDFLSPEAIKDISLCWSNRNNEIGYVFMRRHADGTLISKWPDTLCNATLEDAYRKYHASGDTMLVYKTSLLKKYRFPDFQGEKFVPEAYLYDLLDEEGELRFVHSPIYVCDYLMDGYTQSMDKTIKANPQGYLAFILNRLKKNTSYKNIIGDTIRYIAIRLSYKPGGLVKDSVYPIVTFCLLPFGQILYLKKFRKDRE